MTEELVNGIDVSGDLQDDLPERTFWPEGMRSGEHVITRVPDIYVSVTGVSIANGLDRWRIALKRKPTAYVKGGETGTTEDLDIISKMEITSGPEQPFEMVEISVGSKAFNTVYGDFFDKYEIRPGVSALSVIGMVPDDPSRQVNYTVTSFSRNSDAISMVAYCTAESICGTGIDGSVAIAVDTESASGVEDAVWNIVSQAGNWGFTDRGAQLVSNVGMRTRGAAYRTVPGANAWVVLQALAVMARARIFFAEGKVFLIDYTKVQGSDLYFDGNVALSFPVADGDEDSICDSVIGGVEVVNNGNSSIANRIAALCLDTEGTLHGSYWYDTLSGGKYNAVVEDSLDMSEVIVAENSTVRVELDLKKMAKFATVYRSYAQSDVTFSVAEGHSIGADLCWSRTFPVAYSVKGMRDAESGTYSSAVMSWPKANPTGENDRYETEVRPQTMLLAKMVTAYPAMRTEYTFGTVSSVSLAQKTSEIVTDQRTATGGASVASAASSASSSSSSPVQNRVLYVSDKDGNTGSKVNLVGIGEMNLTMPQTASFDTLKSGTLEVSGDATIRGNLTVVGSSTVVKAETVQTRNDYIIMRDGATAGLGDGSYSGFRFKSYDSEGNDGALVIDNGGTARVGDIVGEGDYSRLQPLLTRAEASSMSDGQILVWDGGSLRASTSGKSVGDFLASGTKYAGSSEQGGAATEALSVSGSAATSGGARRVWFSDASDGKGREWDDEFKYDPSTNELMVSAITGHAALDQRRISYVTMAPDAPEGSVAIAPAQAVGSSDRPIYINSQGEFEECSSLQGALTQTQLEAVNSGITAEKVALIGVIPEKVSAFANDAGYITSSASITGNAATATTATKLATARKITISGNVLGTATFDGSADITINVQPKVAYPTQWGTVKDEYAWQRIATMELPTGHIGNHRYTLVLDIMPDVTKIAGRLTATISYNGNNNPTTTGTPTLTWDWCNSNVDPSQWIVAYTATANDSYRHQAELWCYNKSYGSHHIVQVDSYIRDGGEDVWDLKSNFDDILRKSSWTGVDGRTENADGAVETINGVEVQWKAVTSTMAEIKNNAATATDSDTLDGWHAFQKASDPKNDKGRAWGYIPIVNTGGVLEVGKYIDFHNKSSDTSADYTLRLTGNSDGLYSNRDFVLTGYGSLRHYKDDAYIRVQGGSGDGKGARMALYGKDMAEYGGRAYLIAHDGTSQTTLALMPDSDATLSRGLNVTGTVTAPTFTGDLVGNAATATRLANAVNVSVKDSDGSNTGASVSLRGDADVTVPLPSTIKASLTGHASLDQTRILYNDKQDGAESGSVAVMPVQPVGSGSTPIYIDENGEFKACDDVLAGGVSWSDVTGRPTKVSEFTNDANYATKGDVSALVNSAPEALDTLKELADALGNDPNFATSVSNEIGKKVTANTAITAATKCRITYDSKGLVTGGADLDTDDIPALSTDKLTSGTLPATRGGTGQDNLDKVTVGCATKIGTTTVGGETTPVYIKDGTPTPISYTIAKSVPSDAKFTDTNTEYTAGPGLTLDSTTFRETFPLYYAKPNEASATATLTATIDNFPSAYANGQMIAFYMPFANSENTTLNVNGLGAKPVYYSKNTVTKSTIAAGSTVLLVYSTNVAAAGSWNAMYSYNSNTTSNCGVRGYNLLGDTYNNDGYPVMCRTVVGAPHNTVGSYTNSYVGGSTKITMNPYSGKLTAVTFVGDLTGHASKDQTQIAYNSLDNGAEVGSVAIIPDNSTEDDINGLKENVDDLLDRVGDLEGSMGEVSGDVATEIQALKGGKADKATTLAGYGITDAKIADGVITLGSNTITPLTSHQSLGSYLTISEASNTYQPKGNYLTEHQSLDDYATKDDLTSAVTGLYKIKGSITALPESPEVGDVYNLANALSVSILGAKAATIPAGSNIVYTDNGWDKLSETYSYSLPLATSSKRGGVKVGYVTNADSRNYAVQLDSEMMYVNVPWKDYGDATESGPGLMTKDMVSKLNGIEDSANHYVHPTSGVTAGTYNLVKVDANGHVTAGESKGYATVSGSEALTNKTYNGYTLGAACSKGVTTLGSSGPCGYSGTSANVLVAQSALAFWDGRYNDTGTNLRYAASPSANGDAQSGNGKAPKPIATTDWAQHKVDYKTSVPSSTEGSQNDVVVVADTESVGSTSEPIYKENGVLKKCTAISSALATKTTTTLSPNEPASSSDGDIWFCIEA